MGRHADPTENRRPFPTLWVAAAGAVVVLLLAGGLVWWLAGGDDESCATRSTVAVTVTPEIADLVDGLLSDPDALGADGCVTADVTAQSPLQTAGDLSALDDDALPDVWVPDSSIWFPRAGDAELSPDSSLATSPVVLGTSTAVVDAQGWADAPPTWAEALTGDQPVAMPDIASSGEALAALSALMTSAGDADAGDTAVVQAVLAADRGAGGASSALDAAAGGSADAPLVPVTEQAVYAARATDAGSALTAVYPEGGSPVLDYPVVRVGSPSGDQSRAVDSVVAVLTSADARTAAGEAGFRDADGTAPPAAGEESGIREEAPEEVPLDPDEVQALLSRLAALAAPSRLLAVVDVSASMEANVGGGGTRATLARDAAKSALALIPGRSALGLWVFARELDGGTDWQELVPTRVLDTEIDGRTQREILQEQADSFPTRLSPGGTGLYDTVLAAVRKARVDYDPTAVNTVVIITDGTDEDDGSIGLDGLLQTLASEADPGRPVKVIGIALGPDADLSALQSIGEATGGDAYSALDENDLQTVLFDALRQRG
ncbi:VWA domain-containing protein [Blastococcus sp. TML/M2B]|uniref:VWA domain-containing protein n=1 Tax=unclassified Blastococcus TaxID=2619396 RepID=UPI00190ABD6C|nr:MULTISPECIES: VWA domain-containing protein [unclassified Blastococcus]MBN1091313.1 VWA domain-containing protein [Blastococcus sp. TML/M2B]MBN1095132.1 VWA domain-containing protein [Blastococcus sp. TML/C7B]